MAEVDGEGNDYKLFKKGLEELKPILRQLSNVTRIVWLLQSPIVFGSNTIVYSDNFMAKIHHYNKGIRHILTSVETLIDYLFNRY